MADLLAHKAPSDATLVAAARAGDVQAKETLFSRHLGSLRCTAMRYASSLAEPEDLVQEAVLQALVSFDALEQPQLFAWWLRGILLRKAQRLWKHKRVRARVLSDVPAAECGDRMGIVATCESRAELHVTTAALAGLPPNLVTALYLRRVEGLTLQEVANTMHTSLATTKRWITHADRLIREALAPEEAAA